MNTPKGPAKPRRVAAVGPKECWWCGGRRNPLLAAPRCDRCEAYAWGAIAGIRQGDPVNPRMSAAGGEIYCQEAM